jgi:hypothetical protein
VLLAQVLALLVEPHASSLARAASSLQRRRKRTRW